MSAISDKALEAYQRGDLDLALKLAEQALSTNPNQADALAVTGLVLAQRRDFLGAEGYLVHAIESGTISPTAPAALVSCLRQTRGPESAGAGLKALLAQRPDYTPLRLEVANLHYQASEYSEECALCAEGYEAGDRSHDLLIVYGRVLMNVDRPERAVDILRQAIAASRDDPEAYFLLGAALRSLGKLSDAREAHRAAMEQQPFFARSFYSYMRGGRVRSDDPVWARISELQPILSKASDDDRTYYHYGLGKAFEDLEIYDDAFAHYQRGGALRARAQPYDRRGIEREFAAIKEFFSTDALSELKGLGDLTKRPVFIIGMPRSGSSLVEQILSSHGDVEGLGELLDLEKIARPVMANLAGIDAGHTLWGDMAQQYLSGTAQKATSDASRLVDKGLHNFKLVGLIHVLFPNATILHCRRDPMDSGFSSFALRFAGGHEWSNKLRNVGHYYRQYQDLMAHWQAVLSGRITTITYEDLASDFEPQVRRLLEACALPWDPACLDFYKSDHAVRTASSAQVREPISKSSIGRWRKFEAHLGGLQKELERGK